MISGSKMLKHYSATSGKLSDITGLPNVSETRRMLGAWQKPKGMLVSLAENI